MTLGWRHLCKKCGIEHPRDPKPFQVGVQYRMDGGGNILPLATKSSPIPRPCVELTEIGEQYVIPGCERHEQPAGAQLKLWERSK